MVSRPKLADVAERAGLSITAVSLVLNNRPGARLSDDAVRRVHEAARELGYRPNSAARSLRLGTTHTIGLVSDEVTVTRYASASIRGALDVAEAHAHAVLIYETGSKRAKLERAIEVMVDRQTDGLIFASMAARHVDIPAVPSGLPVVMLNSTTDLHPLSVLPAERDAGRAIARVLLDAGHHDDIAVVGNSPWAATDTAISVTIGDRLDGIMTALAEAGATPRVRNVRHWTPANGYQAVSRLLASKRRRPTGLICLNDNLSFGAYQAIGEAGLRIPEDISVVSFDDDELAGYLRPALTTARIPYEEMGRRAMSLMFESDRPAAGRLLVDMPVQHRGSVGPPAA